jgi:hypothetical protein
VFQVAQQKEKLMAKKTCLISRYLDGPSSVLAERRREVTQKLVSMIQTIDDKTLTLPKTESRFELTMENAMFQSNSSAFRIGSTPGSVEKQSDRMP